MSEDFDAEFTFHPVGHGLFYSGRINGFHFVYDCGTDSAHVHLDRAVARYAASDKLDLLVISHFDGDHINGIKALLEKTNGVKDVFLPYLCPEERCLLLAHYLSKTKLPADHRDADDYVQFLKDPAAWFGDSAGRLIYIRPDRPRDIPGPDTEASAGDEEFSWTTPPWHVEGRTYHQHHKEVLRSSYWYFRFYCKTMMGVGPTNIQEKMKVNEVDVGLAGMDHLSPEDLDRANKVYHIFFRKRQNRTSLMCYHGPEPTPQEGHARVVAVLSHQCQLEPCLALGRRSFLRKDYYHVCPYNNYCRVCDSDMWFYPNCHEQCRHIPVVLGQMLTGDAEICLKDYQDHFANELPEVGLFVLPHHGSSRNWKAALIKMHPNCSVWVCSAGLGNPHKHPGKKVVDDLVGDGKCLIICNELQSLAIATRSRA